MKVLEILPILFHSISLKLADLPRSESLRASSFSSCLDGVAAGFAAGFGASLGSAFGTAVLDAPLVAACQRSQAHSVMVPLKPFPFKQPHPVICKRSHPLDLWASLSLSSYSPIRSYSRPFILCCIVAQPFGKTQTHPTHLGASARCWGKALAGLPTSSLLWITSMNCILQRKTQRDYLAKKMWATSNWLTSENISVFGGRPFNQAIKKTPHFKTATSAKLWAPSLLQKAENPTISHPTMPLASFHSQPLKPGRMVPCGIFMDWKWMKMAFFFPEISEPSLLEL